MALYGVVNLYLTFLEDLSALYYVGNQLDIELNPGAGVISFFEHTITVVC